VIRRRPNVNRKMMEGMLLISYATTAKRKATPKSTVLKDRKPMVGMTGKTT